MIRSSSGSNSLTDGEVLDGELTVDGAGDGAGEGNMEGNNADANEVDVFVVYPEDLDDDVSEGDEWMVEKRTAVGDCKLGDAGIT